MKKSLYLISAAMLMIVAFASSASAYSETQVYKKYTGSSWVVGSYAKTVETASYDKIEVINKLEIDGVLYDINNKIVYNDYWCQTNELTTGSYNSYYLYSSVSSHIITHGGQTLSNTVSRAYL